MAVVVSPLLTSQAVLPAKLDLDFCVPTKGGHPYPKLCGRLPETLETPNHWTQRATQRLSNVSVGVRGNTSMKKFDLLHDQTSCEARPWPASQPG